MNFHLSTKSGLMLPVTGSPEDADQNLVIPDEEKKNFPLFLKKCRRCKKEFQGLIVQEFCMPCMKDPRADLVRDGGE